jgi:ABC-type branched-subunit amino acid transport system substrate-binding protein
VYSDLLVKQLEGTISYASYNVEPNEGLSQMQEDFDAIKPGTKPDTLSAAAYFAADKLIAAVKQVGKKNITPEAVQKVLANQKWELEGFAGPNRYPESTVISTPSCQVPMKSDGTTWDVVVPYGCSTKQFKVP